MAPLFFFLQLKVCKQESRGLKPALQLYLSRGWRKGCGCLPLHSEGGEEGLLKGTLT